MNSLPQKVHHQKPSSLTLEWLEQCSRRFLHYSDHCPLVSITDASDVTVFAPSILEVLQSIRPSDDEIQRFPYIELFLRTLISLPRNRVQLQHHAWSVYITARLVAGIEHQCQILESSHNVSAAVTRHEICQGLVNVSNALMQSTPTPNLLSSPTFCSAARDSFTSSLDVLIRDSVLKIVETETDVTRVTFVDVGCPRPHVRVLPDSCVIKLTEMEMATVFTKKKPFFKTDQATCAVMISSQMNSFDIEQFVSAWSCFWNKSCSSTATERPRLIVLLSAAASSDLCLLDVNMNTHQHGVVFVSLDETNNSNNTTVVGGNNNNAWASLRVLLGVIPVPDLTRAQSYFGDHRVYCDDVLIDVIENGNLLCCSRRRLSSSSSSNHRSPSTVVVFGPSSAARAQLRLRVQRAVEVLSILSTNDSSSSAALGSIEAFWLDELRRQRHYDSCGIAASVMCSSLEDCLLAYFHNHGWEADAALIEMNSAVERLQQSDGPCVSSLLQGLVPRPALHNVDDVRNETDDVHVGDVWWWESLSSKQFALQTAVHLACWIVRGSVFSAK
eukprot:PhM_4_TR8792/c0_g1_i1/m.104367